MMGEFHFHNVFDKDGNAQVQVGANSRAHRRSNRFFFFALTGTQYASFGEYNDVF